MKKLFFLAILFPFTCFAQQAVNIIPQPVQINLLQGNFIIDKNTSLNFNNSNKDLLATANFLNHYINKISGIHLATNKTSTNSIELKLIHTAQIGQEGYLLNVSSKAIIISKNKKIICSEFKK